MNYTGTWIQDDTAFQMIVTEVDLESKEGPPPLNQGVFKISVKLEGLCLPCALCEHLVLTSNVLELDVSI